MKLNYLDFGFLPFPMMSEGEGGGGAGGGSGDSGGEGGDAGAEGGGTQVEQSLMPDMSSSSEGGEGDAGGKGEGTQADTPMGQKPTGEEADFLKQVPDDFKKMVEAKGFDSIESVLKSYSEMEKLSGSKGPAKPDENATEEHVAKWNAHIGVPKDAGEYQFAEAPASIKDENFEARENAAREKMQEFGVPKEAGEKLVNWWNEQMANEADGSADAIDKKMADYDAQIKSEWANDYDKNIAIGKRAVQAALKSSGLQAEELAEGLNKLDDAFKYPSVAKMMKFFGEQIGEDEFVTDGSEGAMGKTKGEMELELKDLEAHPAYNDKTHPEHEKVERRIKKLYEEIERAA